MEEWEREGQRELERLSAETGCDVSMLAAVASSDGKICWKLAAGAFSGRYRMMAERPGRGLAGSVLKVGRPMLIQADELGAGKQLHDYPLIIVEGIRSAYAVPIMTAAGRSKGVLLAGYRRPKTLSAEDRLAIERSALRIGSALDKAGETSGPLRGRI
nr:GAF domain-containing protein [Paenibacillus pasadenensis]